MKAKTFDIYWSPEGRKIATVTANDVKAAKRKCPKPWGKYQGELYALEVKPNEAANVPEVKS